ncbi:MAG: helix-turn-helix domain-containing protein [Selenomonadaceae bacterium]
MKLRLNRLRKQRNLSQNEVANQIGITRSGYSKIETGEVVNLKFAQAVKLAKVFKVPLEELIDD